MTLLKAPPEEEQLRTSDVLDLHLDKPMGILGVIFLFVCSVS
jgi:hypothetical protein